MADKAITSLTAYTPPISTDVLPIVDVTTSTTKKMTIASLSAYLASLAETLTNKTLTAPAITSGTGKSTAMIVGNIAGGTGGSIPYQSAADTTVLLANGTAGQVLTSAGTTLAPSWATATSVPAGSLFPFAAATAPSGYLLCDGSAVSRATYATLFGVVGTTYGVGDGSTTFNLPDLQGRVAVGKNSGTFTTIGASGGEETHVLTIPELAAHTHGPGDGTNFVFQKTSGGTSLSGSSNNFTIATAVTGSTGSGTAHNNLQPYLVLTYIIKT